MSFFSLVKSLTKKEWLVIIGTWLVLNIIFLLPFLFTIPWLSQGYTISGIQALNYLDINYFLSLISQVKDGHFLIDNLYTYPIPVLKQLRPSWLLVGWWARIFDFSQIFAFYTFKAIVILPLLTVIYLILKLFFQKVSHSLAVFLITTFAMGFGFWLALVLQFFSFARISINIWWPLDLGAPETFIFLSSLASPHLVLSWLMLLLIYLFWLLLISNELSKDKKFYYGLFAGIVAMVLFIDHPYHILPVFMVIGLHSVWIWWKQKDSFYELFPGLITFLFFSSLGIIYNFYYSFNDWHTAIKILQNNVITPHLWVVVSSFGFFGIGAILQIKEYIKQRKICSQDIFLIIWFVVHLILIYIPIFFQRRMVQGWQIPMVILSAQWVITKYFTTNNEKSLNKKYGWVLLGIIIFLSLPSSIYSITRNSIYYKENTPRTYVYYSPQLTDSFEELKKANYKDAVFLAHPMIANFIPSTTGHRVIAGHWSESAYYESNAKLVELFFIDNSNDSHKKIWLKEWGITHLFYSNYEKELGDFDPSSKDYIELVWQNNEVQIYKVIPDLLR